MRRDIEEAFEDWLESRIGDAFLHPEHKDLARLAFEAGARLHECRSALRKAELIRAGWLYDPSTGEDLRRHSAA